jgi:hypothetical protein
VFRRRPERLRSGIRNGGGSCTVGSVGLPARSRFGPDPGPEPRDRPRLRYRRRQMTVMASSAEARITAMTAATTNTPDIG